MPPKSHLAPHGQSVLADLCSCHWRARPGLLKVCWELGCCWGSVASFPVPYPHRSGMGMAFGWEKPWEQTRRVMGLGALVSGRDQEAALAARGAQFLWKNGTKLYICLAWMVARLPSFRPPLDLSPHGATSPRPGPIQTAPGMGWWSNPAQGWVGGLGYPCRWTQFT